MSIENATLVADLPPKLAAKFNPAVGYLRAFVVVLVVAHHAALGYHPYAPPPAASLLTQPRLWGAFPVVDSHKWSGASWLVSFNDVFFMSLMFFLSGLFVWHSLVAKGAAKFLRDRLLRLGLPFVLAAGILAPLAYYPTYLQASGHGDVAGFAHEWLSLGNWPAGPAWFLALLLAFDCMTALLFVLATKSGAQAGGIGLRLARFPVVFFAVLIAVSGMAYLPMAHAFTSYDWWSFGPFAFQTSRIVLYFVYFLTGAAVGAGGLDQGLLAPDGRLARRWPLWVAASLIFFAVETAVAIAAFASLGKSPALVSAADGAFVFSCAASCFAFLAMFVRFARSRSKVWDSLAASSYGIYLVHYVFVSWLQYALLPAAFPGVVKWLIVLPGALALSWTLVVSVRRSPAFARVI